MIESAFYSTVKRSHHDRVLISFYCEKNKTAGTNNI